jgi:hypothetical protein
MQLSTKAGRKHRDKSVDASVFLVSPGVLRASMLKIFRCGKVAGVAILHNLYG